MAGMTAPGAGHDAAEDQNPPDDRRYNEISEFGTFAANQEDDSTGAGKATGSVLGGAAGAAAGGLAGGVAGAVAGGALGGAADEEQDDRVSERRS